MSCGRPHATPCAEVLRRVYEYLDGELSGHELQHVSEHLDECGPCLRQYGLEEAVKTLVRRAHLPEPAPAQLRERVLLRVQQVRVEVRYRT